MALRFNLESTKYGMGFPEAYAKIEKFSGDLKSVTILMNVFGDETARRDLKEPITSLVFRMPFNEITGELYASMYFWLQQQPPFQGNSTSC